MVGRSLLALTLSLGCTAGCSATQDAPVNNGANANARPPAATPSTRRMNRAFNSVRDTVMRCLRPGDQVTVAGAFEGASGEFKVSRIANAGAQPLSFAIETCVRSAAEQAEVPAFLNETAPFEIVFVSNDATASDPSTTGTPDAGAASTPFVARATTPPPSIVAGSITVNPRETPVERLRRESEAFNSCYDQALQREHTVEGVIELHLQVDRRGRSQRLETRVMGTNRDITLMQLVARCIESHVRLIDFGEQPAASGDIVVPLTFAPVGSSNMPIE